MRYGITSGFIVSCMLLGVGLTACHQEEPEEFTVALCTDGLDNDGDKLVDCEDISCWRQVPTVGWAPIEGLVCPPCVCDGTGCDCDIEGTAETCTDNLDNDHDDDIDCADLSCWRKSGEGYEPMEGVSCPGFTCSAVQGRCAPQCTTIPDCPPQMCKAVTACTNNQCVYGPGEDEVPCDDGRDCTTADTCTGGTCSGVDSCEAQECQQVTCGVSGKCTYSPRPAKVPCTGDVCHDGVCDGAGDCVQQPRADGAACSVDQCTVNTTCQGGVCTGGQDKCPMSTDGCMVSNNCDTATGTCSPVSKGDQEKCQPTACQSGECNAGLCTITATKGPEECGSESGVPGWQCWDWTCDELLGCQKGNNFMADKGCDDGNPCTVDDKCTKSTCAGQPIPEDDNNPCTTDACIGGVVQHTDLPDKSPCPPPTPCAETGVCTAGQCQSVGGCADLESGPCFVWQCNAEAATCEVSNKPTGAACDDGQFCTINDACDTGGCKGEEKPCDDADPATLDTCSEDSDLCLHVPKCVDAECPDADGNPCTQPKCSVSGQCIEVPTSGGSCDDQLACTTDTCSAGTCKSTLMAGSCLIGGQCYAAGADHPTAVCRNCDPAASTSAWTNKAVDASCVESDGKPCTVAACVAGECIEQPSTGNPCEDGDQCTLADTCASGVCGAGSDQSCDDGFDCTADACDPSTGACSHTGDDEVCDDGVACTTDTCSAQAGCQSQADDGACSDGLDCTVDTCDPEGGCTLTPVDTECDDGLACTTDACVVGEGCQPSLLGDFCLIDGLCVAGGAFEATTGSCLVCQPGTSTAEYTPDDGACDPHATCTDPGTGFACVCSAGYLGDGQSCTACEAPCAECEGTPDTCTACTAPLVLVGGSCLLADGSPCASNSDCVNICYAGVCQAPAGPTGGCDVGQSADCEPQLVCQPDAIPVKYLETPVVDHHYLSGRMKAEGDRLMAVAHGPNGGVVEFMRSGATWTQTPGVLKGNDMTAGHSAADVAFFGDRMFLGVPYHSTDGSQSGAVYAFHRTAETGFTWKQSQGKLQPPDAEAGGYFGFRVSMSGAWAAVSAHRADLASLADVGKVSLYALVDSKWTWQQTVTPSVPGAGDGFGFDIALDGDTLAVGASRHGGANTVGYVEVWTRTGEQWSFAQRLQPEDLVANSYFGQEVELRGDTLLASAPNTPSATSPDPGAVYAFRRVGGSWTQEAKLIPQIPIPSSMATGHRFGWGLALADDVAAVGALKTSPAPADGLAYLFERKGSTWAQVKIVAPPINPTTSEQFGHSVALAHRTMIIGSDRHDAPGVGGSDHGAIWTTDGACRKPAGEFCGAASECATAPDYPKGGTCTAGFCD